MLHVCNERLEVVVVWEDVLFEREQMDKASS
jgi:hypothetical protein